MQNEVIHLRAVELSDVDTLYRWENDTTQWATANTHAPYSRTQLWQYANNYDGDIYSSRAIRLLVCLNTDGSAIGTIDIYDFDPANRHATIGVYIAGSARGNGYGVQALKLATRYAKFDLGIKQMMALSAADNAASHAMLQHAGYTRRGTLREWLRVGDEFKDVDIFQTTATDE